jgi:hypothetical protein
MLNWDKIHAHKIGNTFWRTVKVDGIQLDRTVLEKHFYVREKGAKDLDSNASSKVVSLIDLRRANNLGNLASEAAFCLLPFQEFCCQT